MARGCRGDRRLPPDGLVCSRALGGDVGLRTADELVRRHVCRGDRGGVGAFLGEAVAKGGGVLPFRPRLGRRLRIGPTLRRGMLSGRLCGQGVREARVCLLGLELGLELVVL